MANSLHCIYSALGHSLKIAHNLNRIKPNVLVHTNRVDKYIPLLSSIRPMSTFFSGRNRELLWKSVTSVSNPGRKKGRGRRGTNVKSSSEHDKIGVGPTKHLFPGLNYPIHHGKEFITLKPLPPPVVEEVTSQFTSKVNPRRRFKIEPLERGWSGARPHGRKVGPPNVENVKKFQSWILHAKVITHMTGNLGRKRRHCTFVITGNRNGLAGFATGKSPTSLGAINTAKNRAIKKLIYIERDNEHTVMHDFYARFGNSKIFVHKKPEGYGLVCHRALKICCEAIGIKDLYAKVEGSMNTMNLTKAFFIGLLKQKSYQELAEEKKLHLVEYKSENNGMAKLLASPSVVQDPKTVGPLDRSFKHHIFDGKVILWRKPHTPFYAKLPSYTQYLRKYQRRRNQEEVKLRLMAEYGRLCSFYTETYPECRPKIYRKIKVEPEA